jgi:hypothetical protein
VEAIGLGQWQVPAHLSAELEPAACRAAKLDVVDVLIRDLRELVATVERARGASPPDGVAENEEFDRFVVGLAVHLVVEDLVVRPIITRVLEREELIEERKAHIQLIVRRLARARHVDDAGRFARRMREVRVDLAEHVQLTEIRLLAHAYRVYDEEARRTLAHRHPRATSRMLGEIDRQRDGPSGGDDLDRPFLAWLEGIACEALDIEGLAAPSAIKAVPRGAKSRSNDPSTDRRATPATGPRSSDR